MTRLLARFQHPEKNRWIDLYERADGFFYFREFYEDEEDLTSFGGGVEKWINPGWESGLYDSAEAAERDLRKMAPWLRLPD